MERQIATTQDQSQRLLRCGLSADTADMIGVEPDYDYVCEPWSLMQGQDTRGYFPAWSLSALLGFLPKFIPDAGGDFSYALKIQPCNLPGWTVCYYAYSLDKGKGYHRSEDIIEACVQLIEWLTANGYKLNDCPCREKGGENE